MGNEEIIDYVMENPNNTNPNVLRSMLGQNGGGSSGGNILIVTESAEYVMSETWQTIYDTLSAGTLVFLKSIWDGSVTLRPVYYAGGTYEVYVFDYSTKNTLYYDANSASGYPAQDLSNEQQI